MRFTFIAFLASHLLLIPLSARGDAIFQDAEGDRVHVFTEVPCPADIATRAEQGTRGNYRLATAVMRGKRFRACAAPAMVRGYRGVQVHVIYEDGDQGVIPLNQFQPTTGT